MNTHDELRVIVAARHLIAAYERGEERDAAMSELGLTFAAMFANQSVQEQPEGPTGVPHYEAIGCQVDFNTGHGWRGIGRAETPECAAAIVAELETLRQGRDVSGQVDETPEALAARVEAIVAGIEPAKVGEWEILLGAGAATLEYLECREDDGNCNWGVGDCARCAARNALEASIADCRPLVKQADAAPMALDLLAEDLAIHGGQSAGLHPDEDPNKGCFCPWCVRVRAVLCEAGRVE